MSKSCILQLYSANLLLHLDDRNHSYYFTFISRFKPNFTDEEKAEHAIIAKEYQRQCTILDNAIHKDLATKTWLQGEALRSMRPDLRKEAEILDDDFPPMDRPWPFWDTPPIKGFNAKDYMKKEDDDEK